MAKDWSILEVEACVSDYLRMLTMELAGQSYSKTAHRKALRGLLDNRTDGSVEMKHRNISAALLELGCPNIIGYKPLPNYQQLLFDVVEDRIRGDDLFDRVALAAVEHPASAPELLHFPEIEEPPPVSKRIAEEPSSYRPRFAAAKRDYLALESRNRSLGEAGERFVVEYEARRLHSLGKRKLVDRIEQVSTTRGDGLGFDVLSFEQSGQERLIEVKTTSFARETPFYVTRNELARSGQSDNFHLYRVFEFRKSPRLFSLPGLITQHCNLDPISFVAVFR